MKIFTRMLTVLAITGWAGVASASLITTPQGSDSSSNGVMFDINISGNDLLFESIEVFLSNLTGVSTSVDIYTRTGSYIGNEGSSAGWDLRFSDTVAPYTTIPANSSGFFAGIATLDFSDFVLSGAMTHAFYVVVTDGTNVRYENTGNALGSTVVADASMEILSGIAFSHGTDVFSPSVINTPRDFRGSISYSPVPTPSTVALFGLGLAGLGWSRRKKSVDKKVQ